MKDLIAIKVKIGIDNEGRAKYPEFNQIDILIRQGLDWSKYIDVYGLGWQYDKTSGHKEDSTESPFGQQWGVLIVPEDFAQDAISRFPNEVTQIDETELENFYDNKAHVHEPDEKIDSKILEGIKLKQDLGQGLTADQTKALDPTDPTPGITKNNKKKWSDYKSIVGVNIPVKVLEKKPLPNEGVII